MLILQAKEKEIENLTPDEEFIRGTVGAECQVNFDEFWKDYEKTVVFKRDNREPINIIVNSLSNEVEIPYEILDESGKFRVGVFGITENEVLPTLWSGDIKILYGTDTHGTTPPKYEPNEIDQLRLSKQDKLTAGNGIKIENNVISATGGGGSGGTTDYELLENKPQINGIELLGNKSLSELGINIPTKTSDLENDSGFVDDTALENYYTKTEVDEKTVVDQTYDKNSQNAQSGKAVAEAVSIEQKRSDNTFANALKGNKSDTAILLDDISPVSHEMRVKISSDTVTDLTAVKVSRFGKNILEYPYIETTLTRNGINFTDNGDGTITANGTATADTQFRLQDTVVYPDNYNPFKYLIGKSIGVTGSPDGSSKDTYAILSIQTGNYGNTRFTITNSNRYRFAIFIKSGITVSNLVFKPMIYLSGVTNYDYEFYNRTDYTPNADGTVNGVTSLYPNTTLTTDTDGVLIDCEYNRDINKAFAALEAAIATNNS